MKIDELRLEISDREDQPAAREIHERLKDEIDATAGPANRQALVVVLRDSQGQIQGGLRGYSHWHWLYISHLWVADTLRGLGGGAKLVRAAESEAKNRACKGLYVDTFSTDALRFYLREGFQEVGKISDFPPGGSRFFLFKRLA